MTLLEQLHQERARSRELLRHRVRAELRGVLTELLPGRRVYVFGSLITPARFNEYSDIDIALEAEPAGMSIYQLTALLSERLGRPVDVVLLSECRFRSKITQEGEAWTLPG